ncbi:hypothetical protein [Streptomyces sp. TLI_55]|uniref:hypothetical protein n=1 Tax=Streptomyces sp. TLI_55 TaxID=1938861 RepID=UPI0015CF5679|nr:hypothetical protein [Streptomyces sp. TLI_55]
MLTLIGVAPRAIATGVLPGNSRDGRIGHLTLDDSAAVAATVLAEGGSQGEILEVTGPEAVTDTDIAAALTEATGHRVRLTGRPAAPVADYFAAHRADLVG